MMVVLTWTLSHVVKPVCKVPFELNLLFSIRRASLCEAIVIQSIKIFASLTLMGLFSFSVPVSCPQLPAQRRFRCCSLSLKPMRLVPSHSHFWAALIQVVWPLFCPAAGEPIRSIFSAALLCCRSLKWIPDLLLKTSVTVSHNKSIGKTLWVLNVIPVGFYTCGLYSPRGFDIELVAAFLWPDEPIARSIFEFLHALFPNMPGQVWAVSVQRHVLCLILIALLTHPQQSCQVADLLVNKAIIHIFVWVGASSGRAQWDRRARDKDKSVGQTVAHCLVGFMNLWCSNVELQRYERAFMDS